ncbi:MAG: carbon-nitrogen hydrolase [Gammaproteobacteria bacterium]|nr:carbon-nitrogen hydrolase [Gammaproteobacteria bacterium]
MTKKNLIKLALVQHTCHDRQSDNQEKLTSALATAAAQHVDLIVFPELHNHPYFCKITNPDYFNLAESIPGPTTEYFAKLAKHYGIVIVTSVFERRTAGLYHNTAVVLDSDGSYAGIYRKMHIPDDPGFHEKYYFTPGDTGFKPIQTSLGTLGILICWDQWFPEAARMMALAGAEMLIYPTAIGWDQTDSDEEKNRQLQSWITIQRSHAIANGIPVACCNRVGIEQDSHITTEFWGTSFIAGPQGEILTISDSVTSELIISELDFSNNEHQRRIWPFLRDRRIDAYDNLNVRYLGKNGGN